MENGNGNLYFRVGLDNNDLKTDAEKCKETLASIGIEAIEQGSIIDRALGASGAAQGIIDMEAAIRTTVKEIRDIDFGTTEEKIGSLSKIIRDNELYLASNVAKLDEYKKQAEEAFNKGDTEGLDEINKKIEFQIREIQDLSNEATVYKGMLAEVMNLSGNPEFEKSSSPMLFSSEDEIKKLEALKQKIIDINTEIADTMAKGGDTSQLVSSLSTMNDELNASELVAAKAAAALGEDLGGRAREAQQALYTLNNAVREQQEKIDTLTPLVEEAKAKFEEIKASQDADAAAVERAAATYDMLAASLTQAKSQMEGLQAKQQTAQQNWERVSDEIKTHDSVMVKMLGGYDNYNKILEKLPTPIKSAVTGIKDMTGAAKAFIATPLGAILAALILAYQSIKTALNSTVDGQLKLAEITGKLHGILGQLKELVIQVGNYLFEAFNKPQKAIFDLWNAVKENIVNRFKAVGDMGAALGKILKSAFTLDVDGIKAGVSEIGESFVQLSTGIDNFGSKVGDWVSTVKDAAQESAAISRESRELEIAVSEWQVRNQELEQQKAKARGTMYNTSLSTEERQKAKKEFEEALNEQIAKEIEFSDTRIELQKRTMALTSNSIEDENRLRDLQAERAAIETKRVTQMASLERRAGALANTENREANSAIAAEEKRLKALQEVGNMETDLIISNNERRIDLMKDGLTKTLAEIENEKKQELQKISEWEQKFKKQNKAAGITTEASGLTKDQETQIVQARKGIEEAAAKNTKEALESTLANYLTYEQARTKIKEEYQHRRDELFEKDENGKATDKLREGVTQGNVLKLDKEGEEALAAVDEQFAARSTEYQLWCEQIAAMSLENLKMALEDAKAALKKAKDEGVSGDDLAVAEAKVAMAQKAIDKETARQATITPGQRTIKEWKDLYEALNQCKQAFDEVGKAIGGLTGEILSAAGSVTADTMSMINGIVQLANWSVTATKMTNEGATKAIQSVEKASVILTVISTAFQIATKIINAIKGSHDDKLEKDIQDTQKSVEALERNYDELGKAIDKAYSKDASNLIEQQNKLIKKQQELINQQISDEEKKKDSDEDRIDDYRNKISDLNDKIEENKKKAIDAIFGEDLQSAIENFADAYADAWASGESRATAAKDVVKNMMRQMVQESIKAAIQAGGQMEAIRTKLQEFYADGVLTDWEQQYVLNMANEIQKELDNKFSWADKLMSEDTESNRSGTKGGITSASQETVDELNGRATAIQAHTFSINENTQKILVTTNAILNSVIHIEDHTDDIRTRIETMEVGMKEIRNTVSDISTKGVRIR